MRTPDFRFLLSPFFYAREKYTGDLGEGLTSLDRERIVSWCEYARDRDPVLLAGAGLTLGAEPLVTPQAEAAPRARTWGELSARLRSHLTALNEDISDPLWLAELYEHAFSRERLLDEVRWAVPSEHLKPGAVHRAALTIPWHTILTTNYDDLLERVDPSRFHPIWRDDQLAARGRRTPLIHLHGVLLDPSSIVLTLESYRCYPMRHPGLLTKVRQLFLEHPVLIVGFSAVDPNFIQWMGWLEDVVGPQHPPHLCLFTSSGTEPVSAPRTAYWRGRLQFASVQKAHLPHVLQTMASCIAGSPFDLGAALAPESLGIRQGDSPSDVFAKLLERYEAIISRTTDEFVADLLLSSVFQRLLTLLHPSGDVDQIVARLRAPRRSEGGQLGESGHTSGQEDGSTRVGELRRAIGKYWETLLVGFALRTEARAFDVLGVRILLRDEIGVLSEGGRAMLHRALDFLDLLATAAAARDAAFLSALSLFDSVHAHAPVTSPERARLHSLRALAVLRSGETIAPPPTDDGSALTARQRGWRSCQEGDFKAAWGWYRRSLELLPSGTPRDLRSATVESAWHATWPDRDGAELAEERTRLNRMLREDAAGGEEATTWWRAQLSRVRDSALDELTKDGARPTTGGTGQYFGSTGPAEDLLARAESEWFHPRLCAEAASVLCTVLASKERSGWREFGSEDSRWGEWVSTARRYALTDCVAELRWWNDAGDPDRVEPTVEAALLRAGRWPAEWAASLQLLVPAVTWMLEPDAAERVHAYLHDARAALPPGTVYPSGVGTRTVDPRETPGTPLLAALLAVASPQLTMTLSGELPDSGVARLDLDKVLARRPWTAWVRESRVSSEEGRAVLLPLVRRYRTGGFADRAIRAIEPLLEWGKDQATYEALRTWADSTDRTDLRALVWSKIDVAKAAARAQELVDLVLVQGPPAAGVSSELYQLANMIAPDDRERLLATLLATNNPNVERRNHGADDYDPTSGAEARLLARLAAFEGMSDALRGRAETRWRGLAGGTWQHLAAVVAGRFPATWLGPEEALQLDSAIRAGGGGDTRRNNALHRVNQSLEVAPDFAWRRLSAIAGVLRHANARIQGNAVTVAVKLALRSAPPEEEMWLRWLDFVRAVADDHRVQVRMALASGLRLKIQEHPPHVSAGLATIREIIAADRRLGVVAAAAGNT
jgi:hypothetical protein